MSTRGSFAGPTMNPSLSPMNVGLAAGLRMPGMPPTAAGYPRSLSVAPQYTQRPGMPLGRVGGPMASMGGHLPGPSYGGSSGGGGMPMRPTMGPPTTLDPSRKRLFHHHHHHQLQQQQEALGGHRRGYGLKK